MKQKNATLTPQLKRIARQKFTWFACLTVGLIITAFSTRPEENTFFDERAAATTTSPTVPATEHISPAASDQEELSEVVVRKPKHSETSPAAARATVARKTSSSLEGIPEAEELVDFANDLLGTPYIYGGTTPEGFDCSGYIYYVFSAFNYEMERSSSTQSTQGTEIAVDSVVPGDLLFFTGTDPEIREVGHVGIVISAPDQPVSFIHSSSNGGVKISELEGYYTTRLMFAKRM